MQTKSTLNAQKIVDKFRDGDLGAFLDFTTYIQNKYNTKNPEHIMCYGTWELMSTDLNQSDVNLAKLVNVRMDENTYFLEEFQLKQGSADLLNAAQVALILKDKPEFKSIIQKADVGQMGNFIDQYKDPISALDKKQLTETDPNLAKELKVLNNSIKPNQDGYSDEDIDLIELKIILVHYKHFLEQTIQVTPADQNVIGKLAVVNDVIKLTSSDLNQNTQEKLINRINKNLSKMDAGSPIETSFLTRMKELFMKYFSKNNFKQLQEEKKNQLFTALKEQYNRVVGDRGENKKDSESKALVENDELDTTKSPMH